MAIGLLGKKIGMTQIFRDNGEAVAATVIEAGPCYVLQIKTKGKEGYSALQIGYEEQKEKRFNKPLLGKFKKINLKPLKIIKEVRIDEEEQDRYKIGDEIKTDIFEIGDFVDVTGTSIGKGFQGVVKRWGFSGHPASHGSTIHRAPGSIGASSTPSRVFKGQHMPGRMGNKTITIQNLEVLDVDVDNNLLVVKGSIPGSKGSYLMIRQAKKKKKDKPKQPNLEKKPKEELRESEEKNQKEKLKEKEQRPPEKK